MDTEESLDRLSCNLAPLASSETFSDLVPVSCDGQQRIHLLSSSGTSNTVNNLNQITRDNNFNSLKTFFNFPSVDLSDDSKADSVHQLESHSRIRFPEHAHIINTNEVYNLLILLRSHFHRNSSVES